MNTHLPSPDDLLHAYLDHELETQHEQQFFALLSSDSEYRDRLRQLRSIRNEARRFAIAAPPPTAATEALFDRLGFTDAGIASATISPRSHGSTRSRRRPVSAAWRQTWSPLAAAASAAVITAIILLGLRDGVPAADQQMLADRAVNPPSSTEVLENDLAGTPVRHTNQPEREIPGLNTDATVNSDLTAARNASYNGYVRDHSASAQPPAMQMVQIQPVPVEIIPEADIRALLASLDAASIRAAETAGGAEQGAATSSHNADAAPFTDTPAQETALAFQDIPTTDQPIVSSMEPSPVLAQRMTPNGDVSTPVDTRQFFPGLAAGDAVQGFSIEIRGINASSFPGTTIGPKSDPWMQNMAIGLFYTGEHHDVGLEFGQEPFSQHYQGVEDGKPVYYQQNLMTPWLHATWRYRFTPITVLGGIEPYIMLGGGTSFFYWPMAKSGFGIMYMPDRRVRFHAGLEGSVLAFPYQDKWFTSRRAGMTYGVSILF